MKEYLRSTEIIDWEHPEIQAVASSLKVESSSLETARACFNWVRDEIVHSFDDNTRQCVSTSADDLDTC